MMNWEIKDRPKGGYYITEDKDLMATSFNERDSQRMVHLLNSHDQLIVLIENMLAYVGDTVMLLEQHGTLLDDTHDILKEMARPVLEKVK